MAPGRGTVEVCQSERLPCRQPPQPRRAYGNGAAVNPGPQAAHAGGGGRKRNHRDGEYRFVNIEKGIEIGAEDALKWLTGANKALHTAPEVVAALATLIAAIEKPLADISGVAANPLNIALDIQTVNDLKAAWPAVREFLTSMGVKF